VTAGPGDFRRPIDEPAYLADPGPALAAIAAADPGFDPERFLDNFQQLFFQLKAAWQARDAEAGQAYMTAGMYANWSAQIENMTAHGIHNVLENLIISGTAFVTAEHAAELDRITLRVDASAGHFALADATGEVVFGSAEPQPLTEYWTFERPSGARTPAPSGSGPQCQTCGAPVSLDRSGRCRYCKSPVRLAGIDWAVARVSEVYDLGPRP
jgi:predicted lipid-binding transport protein (Tim44 family)